MTSLQYIILLFPQDEESTGRRCGGLRVVSLVMKNLQYIMLLFPQDEESTVYIILLFPQDEESTVYNVTIPSG